VGQKVISDIILSVSQILIFIYALPFYVFAFLLSPTKDIYGDPLPVINLVIALLLFVVGLLFSGFPIWIYIMRKRGPLPKWLEYMVTLMALAPLEFIFISHYLSEYF